MGTWLGSESGSSVGRPLGPGVVPAQHWAWSWSPGPLSGSPLLGHFVSGDLHHGLDPLQPLGLQLLLHLFGVTVERQASGRCLGDRKAEPEALGVESQAWEGGSHTSLRSP